MISAENIEQTTNQSAAQVICDRIVAVLFGGNESAMARKLKLSPALIHDWRRGRHTPSSGSRALIAERFSVPSEMWVNVEAALKWDPRQSRNEKKSTDPELQKIFDQLALLWESSDEKSRRAIVGRLKTLIYEVSLMHWSMPFRR